jgi:hypothetical protein
MMPTSLRNPRKRPLTSDPFTRQVPSTIIAADEETEAKLVSSLLSELNDCYGLQLDVNPDNSRGGGPRRRSRSKEDGDSGSFSHDQNSVSHDRPGCSGHQPEHTRLGRLQGQLKENC